MGDLTYTRDLMRVTNADTGQIVLDNLASPGGQVLEANFVINVTDRTMDLTFSDQGRDPYWTLNGLDIRPAVLLTEGFAPQGPFTSDGVTVDTFTAVGATPVASPSGLVATDPVHKPVRRPGHPRGRVATRRLRAHAAKAVPVAPANGTPA
jgi:hypothetical protein